MSNKKVNVFAVTAFVKPNPDGIVRYHGRTFKGVVFAKNGKEASEKAINLLIESFSPGSRVTREVIKVRECKPYNDFLIPPKSN